VVGFASLVGRFPQHELTIHRLHAQSAEFRAICADYEEALAALRYWEAARGAEDARAREYRQLAEELEAEIARFVEIAEKCGHPDGGD
jgi:hypothetical protein